MQFVGLILPNLLNTSGLLGFVRLASGLSRFVARSIRPGILDNLDSRPAIFRVRNRISF